MKFHWTALLILILLISIQAYAQAPDSADAHLAAAKAIRASVPKDAKNELDYDYIIATECSPPKPTTPAQEARQLQAKANTEAMPRDKWISDSERGYAEPVRVFDNLYYLGSKKDSIWAVTTSAGIILIDT